MPPPRPSSPPTGNFQQNEKAADPEKGYTKGSPETGELHKDSYAFLALSTVMALSPVLLIVLASSAATLDDKPRSEWGDKVMDIILLVPTIYPVLFAALASKAVKSFALHLAQRGTTLGLLEQVSCVCGRSWDRLG